MEVRTTVADPPWERALVWIGLPLLGAALGRLLDLLVHWVASLPGGPFHGAFELAAKIPESSAALGSVVLGALVGLGLAYQTARERLTVIVSGDRVTLTRGRGAVREIAGGSVSAVFREGGRLVLLGPETEELAREQCELSPERLRDAFVGHGFPWRDGDPYANEYRPWVAATPDLPPGAGALLQARARALAKGERDDAAELRTELAQMGIVVRDEKKRQTWRRSGPVAS